MSEEIGSRLDRALSEEEMSNLISAIRAGPRRDPDPAWTAVVTFYEIFGLDLTSEDKEVREYLENERFFVHYRIPEEQDKEIRQEIVKRRYINRTMIDHWLNIGPAVKYDDES